ncbi:MAG: patatin family protein [Oscillibacter sp.]|jgi:predicted patatin/cPLA2 family phospholipase|nr:patatin family protein [Oscillibacter sp.]
MKTGIVLEGGALRTIYSSGVCDAFLDANLMPDYVIGVSAGIAYGVSYVSRQKWRNLQIACSYANDRRYMGMSNLLNRKNQSYFGLDFVYDRIPNELIPFDYDTFAAYPGEMEAVVTNLNTGKADYLPVPRKDDHFDILRATCAMPVLFPIFHINGQPYLDGGCTDAIPWQRAFDVGCERVVVVLTRERSYVRRPEKIERLIERKYRAWPSFIDAMHRRADDYNESRQKLFDLEREGRVIVLAPDCTQGFSRTERDLEKIRALWQDGYFDGHAAASTVRGFWEGR